MGMHGFTLSEEKFIREHVPNEPISFIAYKLKCSTEKVVAFTTRNSIKKKPLGLRKPSLEYILYQSGISEEQYYEIIDRAAHEPLKFIADDMNISYDIVLRYGIQVEKLCPDERVYTKNYSLKIFKISSEQYDEIVELGKTCTVKTINIKTNITKNCIQKVLYSCGIDEISDDSTTTPPRIVSNVSVIDIETIIKYYPHFTTVRLIDEFGLDKNDISLVVKHYCLEKLPKHQRLCITCRTNTQVGTKSYSSYCRECFTSMMIEYQKDYYPKNKHRIQCRVNEVREFELLEKYQ